MLGSYQQKTIFSIKKYLPIQSMISSSCKSSKHQWCAVLYFKSKLTLPKITEWHSMSLVAHQEGSFSLFNLFGVVSGHVPGSSSLLWLVPRRSIFYKPDIREWFDWKFTMNDFITKRIPSISIKWHSLN